MPVLEWEKIANDSVLILRVGEDQTCAALCGDGESLKK
jgi:hypothetical protein